VFDQYGNALPGYRVQFELVGMGEEDSGSIVTYNPYAHFSSYSEDDDLIENADGDEDDDFMDGSVDDYNYVDSEESDSEYAEDWGHSLDEAEDEYGDDLTGKDGVFDRNKNKDANPLWDRANVEDDGEYGEADDDMAVGYTLDGVIDGDYSLECAAYATLILDETYADLSDWDHVANRINVQVWSPAGNLVDEYWITKEWSTEAPYLDSLVLLMSKTGDDGTYVPGPLTTGVDPVYILVLALDQYGDPIDITTDPDYEATWSVMFKASTEEFTEYLAPTEVEDGVYLYEFSPDGDGTYKLTPFLDEDGSGALNSGELKGTTRTLNWND